MSIFEYDEEREMALMREAEYNAGVEEGMQKGMIESMEKVVSRMLSAGNYTLSEIVNISGLSPEKVMQLKDSCNL